MNVDRLEILAPEHFGEPRSHVAVVGNGPCEGSGATERIMGADAVMRFNNWAHRDGVSEAATRRCDVLVSTMDEYSGRWPAGAPEQPGAVAVAIPFPFKAGRIINVLDEWYAGVTPTMVNPYWVYMACRDLGLASEGWKHPMPTVGFTGLYCLHLWQQLYGWPERVTVAGFTWRYDEASDKIHGRAITGPSLPTDLNHYYPLEALWISRRLWRDPRWWFAPECRPVLERLENEAPQWGKALLAGLCV